MDKLKDNALAELATRGNVAQFVSFGPGATLEQRHSCVVGYSSDHVFKSPNAAIEALLRNCGSVNVRTFTPEQAKGGPFEYGLRMADDVVTVLKQHAANGRFTIVNETIDINDGGISGVSLGGIIEFAPGDTPRAVEKAGVASFSTQDAITLLELVYGVPIELDTSRDRRVEFSVHPLRVGFRESHTITWEVETVTPVDLIADVVWPNRFSEHIGDKAYGLLMAALIGLPVPATTVVGRHIRPFSFGLATGTGDPWTRTCPVRPVPGKFTTARGWLDPIALLTREDPDGTMIASVLSQEGVDARYSGAAIQDGPDSWLIEGVAGIGDDFMQGVRPPEQLPKPVMDAVTIAGRRASERLGAVRFEWVHDRSQLWVVQLHVAHDRLQGGLISPGDTDDWLEYDPADGLDVLRRLIDQAVVAGSGVVVTAPVGVTSHVGDLLRAAGIPARLAEVPRSR